MGSLHAGHASLITRARKAVGPKGQVVVSIFINPTQFSPTEDLASYPRSERSDITLCKRRGANALFLPRLDEIYPDTNNVPFSTYVTEERLSQSMEGQSRPIHFRGVATVVSILLNIVQPTHAVFGEKDFQQATIVRKLIRDLKFPTRLVVSPTIREPDGLAMSSRNTYLTRRQRPHANILWRCINTARKAVRSRTTALTAPMLKRKLTRMIESTPEAELDYIEFFNPNTLIPLRRIQRSDRIALAVRFGKTRLIDNGKL